jgi:hypothetical protein
MKHFAIGDGQKRITASDDYRYDFDTESEATVLWKGDRARASTYLTVISLTPKDPADTTLGRKAVEQRARAKGLDVESAGAGAWLCCGEEPYEHGGDICYPIVAARGNQILSVSVRLAPEAKEELEPLVAEVGAMASTLEVRAEGRIFVTALVERDVRRLAASAPELVDPTSGEVRLAALQAIFRRSCETGDPALARAAGIGFGHLLRSHVPALSWWTITND